MRKISLSANIEYGFADGLQYIVTPNAQRSIYNIVNDFHSGIHSFTIIGSYGTGKSSFLLALESDLQGKGQKFLLDAKNLYPKGKFEILNIVGDYTELTTLLRRQLQIEGNSESVIDGLRTRYDECKKRGAFLVLIIDEFGKVLEHAAKNNPERELYFLQKLAEFVNKSSHNILLLTTLHQNFSAYARGLSDQQANEWTKVKGRFKEIPFVEPIEQLLFLASQQLQKEFDSSMALAKMKRLGALAKETHFISEEFKTQTVFQLYPLDVFSAYAITSAIQRYGQNERSLFTFLASKGAISDFKPSENETYNLQHVYDYIVYNFYSYLKEANADSMNWTSMKVSIERVEGHSWDTKEELLQAIKLVKAIGLLNLFGVAGFRLSKEQLSEYARLAMDCPNASEIIGKLEKKMIIRYAAYKERFVLFEGTDVDLEAEIREASLMVSRPIAFVDELSVFFNRRISPVKAHFYQRGTPRFFDYILCEEPLEIIPNGDTDGYIELIFSTQKNALEIIKSFSASHSEHALIFAYFKNSDDIVEHLYNIKKYNYLLEKVIKKEDRVALTEITNLREHEEALLNKSISDNLFAYKNRVTWIFRGVEQNVRSHREFNQLLSYVCDKVYCETPYMSNELFNRHKLSSPINAARKVYLEHLVQHYAEPDLGFPTDKFPPEKTIYYSLLKNTGLHCDGMFEDSPNHDGISSIWNASEEFLQSTENKAKKISELIKILSTQPYKLKQGFLDFWIPTYLFIRRQDFALYDASKGAFMPEVNMEFFDLLQKHPQDFEVKKFAVDGVKLGFFNQYRRFINLGEEFTITKDSFIETIKPFLSFYVRLDDYTKHTRKFNHSSTMKFRDVLAQAKDPEKAFFEDLPEALGFNQEKLKQAELIREYGNIIQRAIRELRTCYTGLIDRIEERLIDDFDLQSGEYDEYVVEIRNRLAYVKTYLLTDKQREFYHHVMTEYDNRTQWYQSICYTILEQRLDALRDEQEEKLVDDLIYMFRTCEKYSSISQKAGDLDKNEAYSFDLVSNRGTDIRTQTYILPQKDKIRAKELEKKITHILSGDDNVDVCTLLAVLNKKMNQ